jgi:hypothetical protein
MANQSDNRPATLRVHDWRQWQSYRSDRGQPPWIKVHRSLARDPKWAQLTDVERGQLVSLWLLAADHDGEIPADPCMLRKLCLMDTEPDLERLVSLGLLEGAVTPPRRHRDAKPTPSRRQHDAPETETETEVTTLGASASDAPPAEVVKARPRDPWPSKPPKTDRGGYAYPEAFELAWNAYPDRDGPNPKIGAYKAFRARVKAGDDPEALATAARHYAEHCREKGSAGTEFVQQAATFWGPGEPWVEFVEAKTEPHWSMLLDRPPPNVSTPSGWEADLH